MKSALNIKQTCCCHPFCTETPAMSDQLITCKSIIQRYKLKGKNVFFRFISVNYDFIKK